jgi:hypothetical protein
MSEDNCTNPECGVCHICQEQHKTSQHSNAGLSGTMIDELRRERDVLKAKLAEMETCRDAAEHHAATIADDYGRLHAETEALQEAHRLVNACASCGADLLPLDEPPHCPDCVIDEDEEEDWTEDYHAALALLDAARKVKP